MKYSKVGTILCLSVVASAGLFFYFHAFPKKQSVINSKHKHSLSRKEIDEAMNLGMQEFDQTDGKGWRALDEKGKDLEAAILIDNYVAFNEHRLNPGDIGTLTFHAAQSYAYADDYYSALICLETSKNQYPKMLRFINETNLTNEDNNDFLNTFKDINEKGWIPYIEATISFLKGDLIGLQKAKQFLENHRDMFHFGANGEKIYINRVNLEKIQGLEIGLIQGLNYKTAYSLDLALKDKHTLK